MYDLKVSYTEQGRVHAAYYDQDFVIYKACNTKSVSPYYMIEPQAEVTCKRCLRAITKAEQNTVPVD